MVKDRLADLQGEQSDDEDDPPETSIQIEGWQFAIDNFFREAEDLWGLIGDIKDNVNEVKKKHHTILCAPHNDEKTKQELEELMIEIKQISNQVRIKLKTIEPHREEKERMNADLRMRVIQHTSLSKAFVDVMSNYNKTQTDFREKCKHRIQRQLEITGRETSDEELEEMLEQGNLSVFTEGIIMETQQARQTLADIEARHADIIKLENSIRELHDMFMDMAILVENQGELINHIEHLVGLSVNHVESGRERLKLAQTYQSKARKKKIIIICILIFIVTLIIIGITVYLVLQGAGGGSNNNNNKPPTNNGTKTHYS